MTESFKVESFKGLNNRIDPVRLGLEWQLQADNCLCDDAGFLIRRPGIMSLSGLVYKDIYGTRNGRLLAIDELDRLVHVDSIGETHILHAGVVGAPFKWAELGYVLFLYGQSGIKWVVYPDTVMVLGSLCPTSATGPMLGDPISYPPPDGNLIGTRRSQLAVAAWEPEQDRSVLYLSRHDYPHEFRLERDYQLFAGKITLLVDTPLAFIIATDRAIYIDFYDRPLVQVADYGVPLWGQLYYDRDAVWFMSDRGLCKAPPFENVTDSRLTITKRDKVTGAVLDWQGSRYAIIHQVGQIITQQNTQPYQVMPVFSVGLINLIWPELVLSANAFDLD